MDGKRLKFVRNVLGARVWRLHRAYRFGSPFMAGFMELKHSERRQLKTAGSVVAEKVVLTQNAIFGRCCMNPDKFRNTNAWTRPSSNDEEGHRVLVKHRDARAGERHQLVGHQINEQVRHRAASALKVNRARSPERVLTPQGHLGHALGGKAGNEAVAQVAHAADVDVAHRVVVGARKDGEEVKVLRSSLHGVVRVLQAAQLHLRLQELAAPMGATSCPGLASKWILEPASMSFVKARATVTLCSATPFGTLDCCVCTVG